MASGAEIATVDAALQGILDTCAPMLCDLPGVGTEVASQLLVTVGDNVAPRWCVSPLPHRMRIADPVGVRIVLVEVPKDPPATGPAVIISAPGAGAGASLAAEQTLDRRLR